MLCNEKLDVILSDHLILHHMFVFSQNSQVFMKKTTKLLYYHSITCSLDFVVSKEWWDQEHHIIHFDECLRVLDILMKF